MNLLIIRRSNDIKRWKMCQGSSEAQQQNFIRHIISNKIYQGLSIFMSVKSETGPINL